MISQNRILVSYDYKLIKYLYNNYDYNIKISEIACGIAQLSIFLNIIGFKNLNCYEYDIKRFDIINKIKKEYNLDINAVNSNYLNANLSDSDFIISTNSKGSYIVSEEQYLYTFENNIINGTKLIAKYNCISNTGEWIFKRLDKKFKKSHLFDDFYLYEKY